MILYRRSGELIVSKMLQLVIRQCLLRKRTAISTTGAIRIIRDKLKLLIHRDASAAEFDLDRVLPSFGYISRYVP